MELPLEGAGRVDTAWRRRALRPRRSAA